MNPKIEATISQIQTGKRITMLQILGVFFIPILLIETGIIPMVYHTIFLIMVAIVLLLILYREQWTAKMLGIEKTIPKKYLIAYGIFTLLGLLLISQLGEWGGREELARWWHYRHFLYLFIVVSSFQEIAYRGYLIPALGKLTSSPMMIIFSNTLFFTFLHVIFPNFLFNLPLAFLGGLGFGYMYLRYPSLPLIMISHSVLNFAAVLYGFFIIPGITY